MLLGHGYRVCVLLFEDLVGAWPIFRWSLSALLHWEQGKEALFVSLTVAYSPIVKKS